MIVRLYVNRLKYCNGSKDHIESSETHVFHDGYQDIRVNTALLDRGVQIRKARLDGYWIELRVQQGRSRRITKP